MNRYWINLEREDAAKASQPMRGRLPLDISQSGSSGHIFSSGSRRLRWTCGCDSSRFSWKRRVAYRVNPFNELPNSNRWTCMGWDNTFRLRRDRPVHLASEFTGNEVSSRSPSPFRWAIVAHRVGAEWSMDCSTIVIQMVIWIVDMGERDGKTWTMIMRKSGGKK